MPRRKRRIPRFKAGQWVRLGGHSKNFDVFNSMQGKGPWRITSMVYDGAYESDTPPLSPWRAVLDLPGVEYAPSFWEEHLALDLFYSAIHEAVNTKEKEPNDRKNKEARVARRSKVA